MTAPPSPQLVFTPSEVAAVLRVTPETIRRRIVAGELGALEVGGRERKQYRITAADLTAWLGFERAAQLFGVGAGLRVLQQALAAHSEEEVEAAVTEAVRAIRSPIPAPEDLLPPPTEADIQQRFPKP